MFLKTKTSLSTNSYLAKLRAVKDFAASATAIVVGAGSGLSSAAGLTYAGSRFTTYFSDFHAKYGITNMYSGGFFNYPDPAEFWAWWSRVIWLNRYQPAPTDTYRQLVNFLTGSNYFVLTTNVDHQFQQAGVDKGRLFYTQGDYGLFQHDGQSQTFDNYQLIKKMVLSQGFQIGPGHQLTIPTGCQIKMRVPAKLVNQARPFTLNLRTDDTFVEDDGWHQAADHFNQFISHHQSGPVLFLELGVGMNTPGIIKYPFWNWTYHNPAARLVTVDKQPTPCPKEITSQTTIFQGDLAVFIRELSKK